MPLTLSRHALETIYTQKPHQRESQTIVRFAISVSGLGSPGNQNLFTEWPVSLFYSHHLFSPNYLLSCPQRTGLQDGRRKELHTSHSVCESSVHQLHILLPAEKAASNGHVCTRNHVILDQPCQWLAILQTKTDKRRTKKKLKSHSNS